MKSIIVNQDVAKITPSTNVQDMGTGTTTHQLHYINIMSVLKDSPTLPKHLSRFYHQLGLSPGDFFALESTYTLRGNLDDILSKILENWITKHSTEATIGKLKLAFESLELRDLVDKLAATNPKLQHIHICDDCVLVTGTPVVDPIRNQSRTRETEIPLGSQIEAVVYIKIPDVLIRTSENTESRISDLEFNNYIPVFRDMKEKDTLENDEKNPELENLNPDGHDPGFYGMPPSGYFKGLCRRRNILAVITMLILIITSIILILNWIFRDCKNGVASERHPTINRKLRNVELYFDSLDGVHEYNFCSGPDDQPISLNIEWAKGSRKETGEWELKCSYKVLQITISGPITPYGFVSFSSMFPNIEVLTLIEITGFCLYCHTFAHPTDVDVKLSTPQNIKQLVLHRIPECVEGYQFLTDQPALSHLWHLDLYNVTLSDSNLVWIKKFTDSLHLREIKCCGPDCRLLIRHLPEMEMFKAGDGCSKFDLTF